MPPLETRDIPNVELARTGTYNASTGQVTFTRKDFDDAVSAYAVLKGKVDLPVKLGHADEQSLLQEDGLPAAGWLENVRRVGNRLVADLMKVPARIADLMAAGGYRKRSIEAMRNGEFGGQRWPFVLTGLALLGEDLPAVDSLKDIESLYQAASLDMPEAGDAESQLIIFMSGVTPGKEEHVMDLTKLRDLLGLGEDADEAQVEAAMKSALEKGKQVDELSASLEELKKQVEDGKKGGANDGDPDPKPDPQVAELKRENADLTKRLLALEEGAAQEKATAAVDAAIHAGKFLPASRGNLIKLALKVPEEFREMVQTTPDNAVFASGAKGGAGNGDQFDLSEYEPTEAEMQVAAQMGNTREQIILAKLNEAERMGTQVPQAVKAKLQPKQED